MSEFKHVDDLVVRRFKIGTEHQIDAFVVFLRGLVDKEMLQEHVIMTLMTDFRGTRLESGIPCKHPLAVIKENILSVASLTEVNTLMESTNAILSGNSVLFIDGSDAALAVALQGAETRGVSEPETEVTVRGPREGFVESLQVNVSMVRRKIKNANVKLELMTIGRQTKTDVGIMYVKGIVDNNIVLEVKKRLQKIQTDSILESGYIESFIEDAPFSIFATIGNSEKPDVVSAKLLEGRVAILVDGTPFVLTAPYLLIEAFQSSEDYYIRPYYATFIRMLRWMAFLISVFLPSAYVAITTFHQELLPSRLLTSIAASKEGTPFPSIIEALMMQIIFEILREAGIRLPRPVGQAVSIVGALVLGEAAVSAGLIGAPMVIVVALTAITSFVVPALIEPLTIARLLLIILAGFAGQFGIWLGVAGILTHLCSLRSFGVPYTSPLTPSNLGDMKDVLVRVPLWAMHRRPQGLGTSNTDRQQKKQMPAPPENGSTN
ncbi:spore germination protein [Paenibacillus filicis]|uniref:Spore germination protein n=1 Tax=Paenibacillus gyeongsangnamensis TaxID=3388067 RepID=A0ABT4QLG3_9BACL|nr:spore germination protein [Paenibacillus filicis]MCZ8517714.1 spore germination protein [Paenibacillus filicis]